MAEIGYNYPCSQEESSVIEAFRLYFERIGTAEERFALWAKLNTISKDPFGDKGVYQKDLNTFNSFYYGYNQYQKLNTDNFFIIYNNMEVGEQNFIKKVLSKSMRLTKYGNYII